MTFTPVVKGTRPWSKAKMKANAPTSVAVMTGTKSRVTLATGNLTTTQISQYLGALVDDLVTSGVIKAG